MISFILHTNKHSERIEKEQMTLIVLLVYIKQEKKK